MSQDSASQIPGVPRPFDLEPARDRQTLMPVFAVLLLVASVLLPLATMALTS